MHMVSEPNKSPFALRLEDEMRLKGIADRAELSRKTGIPYHRLNPWWVRPTAKPNAADLLSLATFFDIEEDYLLNGGERRPFNSLADILRRAGSLGKNDQADLESYLIFLEARAARRKSEQ